jgi:hypothetical protein
MNDEMEKIWKEAVMAQLRYYPTICLGRLKKTAQESVRIAGALAEIQTEHHPNMSLEGYHYTNQLSSHCTVFMAFVQKIAILVCVILIKE